MKNRKNQVVRLRKIAFMKTYSLVQPPPDFIANYGRFTNFFAHNYRQAVSSSPVIEHIFKGSQGASDSLAVLIHISQRVMAMKSMVATNHNI